jgi:hypothetical protein
MTIITVAAPAIINNFNIKNKFNQQQYGTKNVIQKILFDFF